MVSQSGRRGPSLQEGDTASPRSPGVAYHRLPSAGAGSAAATGAGAPPAAAAGPGSIPPGPAPRGLPPIATSTAISQHDATWQSNGHAPEEDLEPDSRTLSAASSKYLPRSPLIGKPLRSPSSSVPARPAPWAESGSFVEPKLSSPSAHSPAANGTVVLGSSPPNSSPTVPLQGSHARPPRIAMPYQPVPEDRPLSDGSEMDEPSPREHEPSEAGTQLVRGESGSGGPVSLPRSSGQRYTRSSDAASAAAAAAAAVAASQKQGSNGFNPFTEEEEQWLETMRDRRLRLKERLNVGLNYMAGPGSRRFGDEWGRGPGDMPHGGMGNHNHNLRGMSMRYAMAPPGGALLSRTATLRHGGVPHYMERAATHSHNLHGHAHHMADASDASDTEATSPHGLGRSGTRRGRPQSASASAAAPPSMLHPPAAGSPQKGPLKSRLSHADAAFAPSHLPPLPPSQPVSEAESTAASSQPASQPASSVVVAQAASLMPVATLAQQAPDLLQVPTLAVTTTMSLRPAVSQPNSGASTPMAGDAAVMIEQPSIFSKHAKAMTASGADSPPTPSALRKGRSTATSRRSSGAATGAAGGALGEHAGAAPALQVDVALSPAAPCPSPSVAGLFSPAPPASPFASLCNVKFGASPTAPAGCSTAMQQPARPADNPAAGVTQPPVLRLLAKLKLGGGRGEEDAETTPETTPHAAAEPSPAPSGPRSEAIIGAEAGDLLSSLPGPLMGFPHKPKAVRLCLPGESTAVAPGASDLTGRRRSSGSPYTSPAGSTAAAAAGLFDAAAAGSPPQHPQGLPPRQSVSSAGSPSPGGLGSVSRRISQRWSRVSMKRIGSRVSSHREQLHQASFLRIQSQRQGPGGLGLGFGGLALQLGSVMQRGVWDTQGFKCTEGEELGVYIPPGLQQILPDDLVKVRELGRGCFGSVWLVLWCGVEVALKELHQSVLTDSQQAEVFLEAERLAALRHPCVIAFYGIVTSSEDSYGTVVEYVNMGSLRSGLHKLRKQGHVSAWAKAAIALQAARGMEYLHFQGVVHFDLKCDNLLCDLRDLHRPIVKIADLGLSKLKQGKSSIKGKMLGTLPWMAPELFPGGSMGSARRPRSRRPSDDGRLPWMESARQPQSRRSSGNLSGDDGRLPWMESTRQPHSRRQSGNASGDDGRLPWLESGAPVPRSRRDSGTAPVSPYGMSEGMCEEDDEYVTEKVDVYSFGVCLWEVWTLGELPYTGWAPAELRQAIMNGSVRPDVPPGCDPLWVQLMQDCWAARPHHRPSFTEVAQRLAHMMEVYAQQEQPPSPAAQPAAVPAAGSPAGPPPAGFPSSTLAGQHGLGSPAAGLLDMGMAPITERTEAVLESTQNNLADLGAFSGSLAQPAVSPGPSPHHDNSAAPPHPFSLAQPTHPQIVPPSAAGATPGGTPKSEQLAWVGADGKGNGPASGMPTPLSPMEVLAAQSALSGTNTASSSLNTTLNAALASMGLSSTQAPSQEPSSALGSSHTTQASSDTGAGAGAAAAGSAAGAPPKALSPAKEGKEPRSSSWRTKSNAFKEALASTWKEAAARLKRSSSSSWKARQAAAAGSAGSPSGAGSGGSGVDHSHVERAASAALAAVAATSAS